MKDCTLCTGTWTCPWCEHLADKANRIERDALWARYDARKQDGWPPEDYNGLQVSYSRHLDQLPRQH